MNKQDILKSIKQNIEQGELFWTKSWYPVPKHNPVTGIVYKGINRLMLANSADGMYFTFNQVRQLGGHVKAGVHGHPIFFYKYVENVDEEGNKIDSYPVFMGYWVFGMSQVELPDEVKEKFMKKYRVTEPVNIEGLVNRIKEIIPGIEVGFNTEQAYFVPSRNEISIPELYQFKSQDEQVLTFLHECGHAIVHNILKEKLEYAEEECVVEIASVLIASHYGHSANIMNTSAYVQGWQAKALQVVSWEKVCKLAERIFETFTAGAQQEQVKAS